MYVAADTRYDKMIYRRCGRSGIKLPVVSLGLWHNFGSTSVYENSKKMLLTAFDLGITHFDLANNYGPVYGSAEKTLGRVMAEDLKPYRDELIISTKAGYDMWPGCYGDFGSKKYLVASLDQSLKRMGLDYVDIFYHHRPDPETPIEETMDALAGIVRSGKALYVGISNYPSALASVAIDTLEKMGVHCLIEQPSCSMFNRWIEEDGLLDTLGQRGVGAIAFSPLSQGLLTNRYLNGDIPADSRAGGESKFLTPEGVTKENIMKARAINEIAAQRGQTLAQLALAWVLRDNRMTSVIIGASKPSQIIDCAGVIDNLEISDDELARIDEILAK